MPHRHSEVRVYTVISGVFYIGVGDEFDADKLEACPPGAVSVLPGNKSFSYPFRGVRGGIRLANRVRWGNPREVMVPLSRLLPSITARTLVVHCSDDLAVPESVARRSTEAIPDARLLILDGPHFIPLTHPELVAHQLSDFFTQP